MDRNFTRILGVQEFDYDFISNNWVETDDNFKSMQVTDTNFIFLVMMTKVDRASMANSLEIRSPFVDHKLIEYIMSVNSNGYTSTRDKKKPLKRYLNNEFEKNFYQEKMGFAVPLEGWIKKNLEMRYLEQ